MVKKIHASFDKNLSARIVARTPLTYANEAEPDTGRPPHVRAASSLAPLREQLAVIQDDARFLAVVEPKRHSATSISLPATVPGGPASGDGSGKDKLDLEACVAVPGTDNRLLVALGSGSKDSREWIMLVDWREEGDQPQVSLHHADSLFNYLRAQKKFCGAGLNIEGAVFPDDDTLRLFQRGNFSADDAPSVDATADLDWSDVQAYLQDENREPPQMTNLVQYELGDINGARLNFSDAEKVGQAVIFSASAEAGATGENAGAALGIIDGEQVRWSEVLDENNDVFTAKIEGLSVDPANPHHVWFVIDADDPDNPSEIFEAELSGPWYPGA